MKYGLRIPSFALGPRTASLETMGAYLRRAEDLGFDSAVTIDHLLLTPPAYACTWLEPMTMLAALAGVTRTIRLGTMVLVLPLRNPVYFAKEWATLDLLSGGRSILGIGVGWHEEEFALMGVPYRERGRAHERGDRGASRRCGPATTSPTRASTTRSAISRSTPSRCSCRTRRSGSAAAPSPRRRSTARRCPTSTPCCAASRATPTPGCPTPRPRPRWSRPTGPRCRASPASTGATPRRIGRVYSNFVWVLKPGEKPETAAPHFKVYSGMDLDYWKTYYLLGTAQEVADRISARIAALDGGVDHIVLNPLELEPRAARADRRRGAAASEAIAAPIRYTGARVQAARGPPAAARGTAATSTTSSSPRMLAVAFVRSPHAHADVRGHRRGARRARCPAWWPSSPRPICAATSRPLAPRLTGGGFTPTAWPAARATARCASRARRSPSVAAETPYLAADARELVASSTSRCRALAARGRRARRRQRARSGAPASRGDVDGAFAARGASSLRETLHARPLRRRRRWSRAAWSPTGTARR